ncbi:hypothetical protein BNJ_00456 [Kaumoebavirus]|uniref:hypothetical protein n=1 Tax=Kaumoebavirus TaxID=1859492 RepID=UPI0009C2E898|nr:hypothetical protein BNJ_00456 [Kaumoebavirus]ARA72268.1 hypothetical protein BNJ_00456 [Kaumoebavirus]
MDSLPGDIVGEIATKSARAYWLLSLVCRNWLKAVRRALPKFRAVAKFSRRIEINCKKCKVIYTVLPNGKKNGVQLKETSNTIQESFYVGGERIYIIKKGVTWAERVTQRFKYTGYHMFIMGSRGVNYSKDHDETEFRISRYKNGAGYFEKYVEGEYRMTVFRNASSIVLKNETSMIFKI